MDDYPSTRSQQKQYHGQPTAGPSSNMPGLMPSSSNPNNGSGYRPSDNPGFWSSTSMRTTYASYKSHPDAWQKNYLSTIEDLKAFSFGNPASDVVDQEDKRWKIARREENETSSSSSDDGESRRRLGGRSRDVTPRASVVSLDDPVDQPDTHLRSHPSQLQQINYYQRGPSNFGNKIREMNDRDQSSELRERVNDEERRPESRSDFSIYSGYDTGYDAASSHLSRSHSYAPSYTSDHARTRADADAETISISSSRPASSAASGVGPLLDGDRPYDSDDLSISSVRRSSSYDEEYEQAKGVFVYDDAPRPSDANPGRISLESAASSNMHLSVSSLRFDYGLDVTTNEQPEASQDINAVSNLISDHDLSNPTLTRSLTLDSPGMESSNMSNDVGISPISGSHHFLRPYSTSPSDVAAPLPRGRLRSLSTSAARAPSPTSTSAAQNALAGYDLKYITSGLPLGGNTISQTSPMPYAVLEKLHFVQGSSIDRPDVDVKRAEDEERGARMERAERDDHVRGVPMGWEDDLSIPAPFSHAIPERRRARAATTTAALSVGENTFSNHPMSTGTTGISRTNYLQSSLAQAGSENSILQPRSSFPSGKHKHRSASPHKDLTALLDQSEINSANGMPNVVQSTPSLSSSTVRRKRSVFANLGALGIGSSLPLSPSRTKEAQAEILQSMSPVSPARTIKGEVRRTNTETEPAAERLPWELQDSAVFPLTSSPITSLPSSSPISPDAPFAHPVTDPAIVSSPSTDLSASIRSFAYDDSFARSLMVWGGPDYAGMRREWVIRKEKRGNFLSHSDRKGTEIGKMEKNSSINSTGEQKKDKEKDATWTGMSVGAEEVWENFLLGKFTVARDDVSPRSGGNLTSADATVNANSRGEGSQSLNTNLLGFRVPVGKPPQQRLIIKHLREEDKIQVVATSSSNRQIKNLNSTTPEDPSSSSAPDQELHSDPPVPNSDTVDSATSNLRSHRRDFQHPSILVHKHSRVAAFSISRQYRASSKEDKESASGRFHVVMLAPRDVQEAFTNTATTKKLGTVIDRHEAARAAFSPGHDQTIKEKDGKTKVKKQTSLYISSFRGKQRSSYRVGPVKSEGRIELDQRGVENRGFRQNASMPLALAKNSRTVQDTVGTQSAPAYGKSAEFTRSHDIGPERSVSEGQHIRVQAQNKLESRENHKRAYGTLDHPPHSFGTLSPIPPAPSRPAKILKRFLPWDLSLSSVSTSGHSSNSKVTSSTGSTATTAQSVSTGDTTPTHSTGSDISIPYDPPWVTFTSREQQEIQRNVLGQLEDSFEYVGLLPAKDRDKDSERSKNSNAIKRDRLHEIQVRGIMPKLHKKNDVLSFVPADAFFMLLPLWPAETDVYSQRSFPFQIPPTLVESRTYLLVFYKSLQMGESSKGSSIYDSQLKVLLPSFRAIARLISYQELQGTGIRIPEQGVSVNGPLESAFAQRPRLNDTVSEASIATTTPVSNSPSTAQLCVIASSYSRDAGLEFDPEALIELGLCRVLSSKENANALGNRPPAMEMGEKEDQLMTVKLTPIGSAVMEMVWVGGLALTSFGS